MEKSNTKIIGLSNGIELAKNIAKFTKIHLIPTLTHRFADGEIMVVPQETVRHHDIILVQSVCKPVNESLMELLICIDALKKASANSVTVFISYYGYARQDRKSSGREPITAKLVAKLIEAAGADRIMLVDIHSGQIQGFFEIPVDIVYAYPILVSQAIKSLNVSNLCIVSPDYGGVKRARTVSKLLNCDLAILDKRRPKPNVAEIMNVLGNVKGKDCLIIDDMIDTAGTITKAATTIKANGAKSIRVIATHGVLSGEAIKRLKESFAKSEISELYVSNSIPTVNDFNDKHIKVIDLSLWLAGIAKVLISKNQSLSSFSQKCTTNVIDKIKEH